jgi:GT2 family glycosyltransferase/glycosyltransferase involved in cell wall biosynthesis
LDATVKFWRARIGQNQELAVRLGKELGVGSARLEQATAYAQRTPRVGRSQATGSIRVDRGFSRVLERQSNDPSLANFPEFSVRVAARLGESYADFENVRRLGGLLRLLRGHLRTGNPISVARRWQAAIVSTVVEGFRGKPQIPEDFDEISYLLLHHDIAESVAKGNIPSGYDHWSRFGKQEGRLARFRQTRPVGEPAPMSPSLVQPARTDIPPDFDEDAYLFLNPDIASAVKRELFPSGYHHWTSFGRLEGRGGGPWEEVPDRSKTIDLLERRPYGVNFYGFLSTISGLGTTARSTVEAIETARIPINKLSIPSWEDHSAIHKLPQFSPYRVNLLQQNADMMARFTNTYGTDIFKGSYNIGYWLWELPSARSDWHHLYRYVDELWVASEFCRHSFQSITKLPVTRISLVVDGMDEKATYPREHFDLPKDVFGFAYIFDVSSYMDRKNPLALVEAFKREFGASRDVLLYLKYFNTRYDEDNIKVLHDAIGGAPNIRTFNGIWNENEIVSFQKSIDCLVSPHRAEGFGYNLAEAMYFGKPVIGTRYSANLDFMRDDNSYLIDCNLVPIPLTTGPYVRGHVWADPSVEHLSHLMRQVFEDSEGREEKGRKAAEEIRTNYSREAIGRRIANRLEEIGLRAPRVSPSIFKDHGAAGQHKLFHPQTPARVAEEIRGWTSKPIISVITPVYNVDAVYLRDCIESVLAQYYPFWELCLCDDGSTAAETVQTLEAYRGTDPRIKIVRLDKNLGIAAASNRAAEISTGEFLAMLDNDDELAPEALYEVAKAIQEDPQIDFLYTDEDKIGLDGEFQEHYCKPDWSPELLLSVMYILHLMVLRKDLFYDTGGFRPEFSGAQDYDLALRVSTRAQKIHHVPKILYHWRRIAGSAADEVDAKPEAIAAGLMALDDHLRRNRVDATVEDGLVRGVFRVRQRVQGNPLASLCILASGRTAQVTGRGNVDLLANFMASIAEKTDYPNYEIVVVDDGNLPIGTQRAISSIPHRTASSPQPNQPFNFSKKANFAFRQARGRHIILLNDDMEVISPEWLTAMMEFAQQDSVGVVGAKLLFPDDRIQHTGVVVGVNGGSAHVYHGFPPGHVGYNAFTHVIRNYSAVTGACMATRIDVVEALGGFDEEFAVDFNDTDFCLSAIRHGYRVVYTPYAELYHFEGTSLPRTTPDSAGLALFRKRWADYLEDDPYYNPNLSDRRVDFAIDPQVADWPAEPRRTR